MLLAASIFAGVDPTAAHKSFTYAALDRELNVVALGEADQDEMLELLAGKDAATVAVNAPSHLNVGLLRKSMQDHNTASHQLRGVDMRVAEHELRLRGILVSGTGAREASCAAWVRIGLNLYRSLEDRGFEPYPSDDCPHRWLETHPHAAFCALLGRSPLSKPSLEGRLQRQLVLFERGVRLRDPMEYFEEITRHKLLNGILPADLLYAPEQLDALVAAYTAWVASEKAAELCRLGDQEEGFVHLPVRELKQNYQS
jgi:hypothetical protein